jgi:hypothetical protein
LNVLAAGDGTTEETPSTPGGAFIDSLAAACLAMAEIQFTSPGSWAVYSRVGLAMSVINHGYVDNEWDTQRRRGLDATSRELWAVTPP